MKVIASRGLAAERLTRLVRLSTYLRQPSGAAGKHLYCCTFDGAEMRVIKIDAAFKIYRKEQLVAEQQASQAAPASMVTKVSPTADADRKTPGKAEGPGEDAPAETELERIEREEIQMLKDATEAIRNPKRPPTMMSQARRAEHSTLQQLLSQPYMPPVLCLERPVAAAKRPAPAPAVAQVNVAAP